MLGKRVLVIEDDKDSLQAISELLRRAELEVLTATTGREGLRLLHGETPPDFVVLDFLLPDMTGQALLDMRTHWPGATAVPVVLMTGEDGTVEHADLEQLGVAALLRKPVNPDELMLSVQRALSAPRVSVPPEGGTARQARRLSDLLTRVSEVLAQGTDIGSQLRDVARTIVPAYAAACVIERVDTAAALREVMWTQHESSALDAELRSWACQPDWFSQAIDEVLETGKPRLLELDTRGEGGTRQDVAGARALGFESVVIAPMIARRRQFGIVTLAAPATRRYGRSHVEAFADLAHRVALSLDNAELCAEAQQTRRDQDELLAALASELQAPLTALASAAEKALQRAGAADERSLAETFLREARRMELQLCELMDYAQLGAGQLQLHKQDVELEPLLRRAVEHACHGETRAKLTLQVDTDVAGLRVHADPERLTQALKALLGVALVNTPDDAKLEVSLSHVERSLQLTLSGSSGGELAALRDMTPYRERPAFGLRLARSLIEALGGRLWVDADITRADVGDYLHVSVPLCAAHAQDTTDAPPPDTVILLVDSDLAFRRELQEILSECGYNVHTADNGLQAWQYLLGHSPPALILFDLALPAMDGWELHAAIKSHAALQLVPTVVVSGLDRYRIEATLPDAHGYIEKPIRSAQLFEVVKRHVASPARPRTVSVRPSSCF
jgi:CheY-like chemotaxis protein